ncbi:MAG: YncE family protein, partial [Vicinamibacterales bacterium]
MTMRRLAALGLFVAIAVTAPGVDAAADLRTGFVIVANQASASASLIDLDGDRARVLAVGDGPHEAVIAPSGRTAVVTIYGLAGKPGNGLAVVDVAKGVVTRTISLGEYVRPHGAWFLPGDETRVAVTSEATQRLVLVNLVSGEVEAA